MKPVPENQHLLFTNFQLPVFKKIISSPNVSYSIGNTCEFFKETIQDSEFNFSPCLKVTKKPFSLPLNNNSKVLIGIYFFFQNQSKHPLFLHKQFRPHKGCEHKPFSGKLQNHLTAAWFHQQSFVGLYLQASLYQP